MPGHGDFLVQQGPQTSAGLWVGLLAQPHESHLAVAAAEVAPGRACHALQIGEMGALTGLDLGGAGAQAFQASKPPLAELAELLLEHVFGVDRPPGGEIVVGDADHGGTVSGRFGVEQIPRSGVLRGRVEHADMEGKLLKRLAELLAGRAHSRRHGRTEAGENDLVGGAHQQLQNGRRVATHRPAQHQSVHLRCLQLAQVLFDQVKRWQPGHGGALPGGVELDFGHGLESAAMRLFPQRQGFRAGTDLRDRVVAHLRGDAADEGRQGFLADAHQLDVAR